MPLEHLLPTLKARWLTLALTWAAVVAVVAAISLALPPRYEATATVAVEMAGADPIGGQAVFKPAGAVSTHIATQLDILKSEEVALGALRSLKLDEQPQWRDKWQEATGGRGSFEAWLAAELLRQLDVQPSRDSNVLKLSYRARDPGEAAAVANAFVRSYIDTTLQMQIGPARSFNAFFGERAKALRDALEQARARLTAYEREHGITVSEEQDAETARLTQMNAQLVALQDAAAEATNRRRQASATLDAPLKVNQARVAELQAAIERQQIGRASCRERV